MLVLCQMCLIFGWKYKAFLVKFMQKPAIWCIIILEIIFLFLIFYLFFNLFKNVFVCYNYLIFIYIIIYIYYKY